MGSVNQGALIFTSVFRHFFNIQAMKTAIILTILGMFGSLTNACCLLACCKGNTFGRMDDTEDAFETLAFGVCNTDGIEGLSWDEVEQCEEQFCNLLTNINCPTRDDFDFFDVDGNGILTWSEWKSLHG